ncbi:alpha/beta hydrolase fold domain-containing protein [Streptomyces stelliscabiei]
MDYAVAARRTIPPAVHQAYDVTSGSAEKRPGARLGRLRLAVGGHSAGANLTRDLPYRQRRGTFTRAADHRLRALDQLADPANQGSRIAKAAALPPSCGSSPPRSPDPGRPRVSLFSPGSAGRPRGLPPALVKPPRTTDCATRATPTPRPLAGAGLCPGSPTACSRASTTTSPTPAVRRARRHSPDGRDPAHRPRHHGPDSA